MYQAKVVGGRAEGLDFILQTVFCPDCNEVLDAVTSAKVPLEDPSPAPLPSIDQLMRRLSLTGRMETRWEKFDLSCAVSPKHIVRPWNDPDLCPKCGVFLERSGIAFRQWT
jgi:hypothetical protein